MFNMWKWKGDNNMKLEMARVEELIPYLQNPRKNEKAVEVVMRSIQEYGFLVPMVIGKDKVIITGHTRLKAAMRLGMTEVPVIYAENLSESQIKGFRIMDNRTSEYSEWDNELLIKEMNELKSLGYNLDNIGYDLEERNMLEKIQSVSGLDSEERSTVITVEPPNAPPLKERVSIYCEDEKDYFRLKEFLEGKTEKEKVNLLLKLL